jgi:hypothetical protein
MVNNLLHHEVHCRSKMEYFLTVVRSACLELPYSPSEILPNAEISRFSGYATSLPGALSDGRGRIRKLSESGQLLGTIH